MNSAYKKPLIIFDGYCNLCSASVQFILRNNTANDLYFTTLQSIIAQNILQSLEIPKITDSVLFYENGELYQESTAALRIAKRLKYFKLFFYLLIWIPSVMRDPIYRIVSKNRYRWFGKTETCMLPTKNFQHRFIM